MPMTTTRSKSQRSEPLISNSGTSLSIAKGRGKTPLKPGKPGTVELASGSSVSLAGSNSSTSVRAIRSSPVSLSLSTPDHVESEEGAATHLNPNRASLDKTPQTLGSQPLDRLTGDREFVHGQGDFDNAEKRGKMATDRSNTEAGSSSGRGMDNMETFMSYLQEAMRTTREEFRQELNAIRDVIGQTPSEGVSPASLNIQGNSFSNASLAHNVRLKDWKVSYSGEGNVNDFLFKIDTLTDRSRCPLDYLMANFHMFLTQKAETWYWMFVKQNPRASYAALKTALISEFGTLETESEILLKISTRKQHAKESYDDFHAYIVQMNLRLRNPMSDTSLIEIIKKNVSSDLRIMLFISEPRDLGELRLLAKKAERILQESKFTTNPLGKPRRVDELSVEEPSIESDEEQDPQVAALKISRSYRKGDYSRIKCWNCLQLGHSYIYCPDETRRVFCFKCGKRDVTTPKCSEPHSENKRRSGQQTGDVRSTN